MSIFSVGRRSPGPNSPERIRSRTAALTAWLSVWRPSCIAFEDYTCHRLCPIVGTNKRRRPASRGSPARRCRKRASRVEEGRNRRAGVATSTPPRSARGAAASVALAPRPRRASPRRAPRRPARRAGGADVRGPRAELRATAARPAPRPATATDDGAEPVCSSATARTSASLRQTPSTTARASSAGPCSEPSPRTTARTSVRQTGARSPGEVRDEHRALRSGSDGRGESEHLGRLAAQQPGEPLDRGAARLGRAVVDGEGRAGGGSSSRRGWAGSRSATR